MPDEASLAFERKWPIENNLNFVLVDGTSIFGVDDLVEVFLISTLAVSLAPLDGQSTMIPLPIVLDDEVYHF